MLNLTPDTFTSEVLNSPIPVLVDFWAPWCGPCRVMNPIVNAIAEDYDGQIKVAKLNVDEAPDLASRYQITAIPTILIIQNGEVIKRFPGLTTKDTLDEHLKALGLPPAIAA